MRLMLDWVFAEEDEAILEVAYGDVITVRQGYISERDAERIRFENITRRERDDGAAKNCCYLPTHIHP